MYCLRLVSNNKDLFIYLLSQKGGEIKFFIAEKKRHISTDPFYVFCIMLHNNNIRTCAGLVFLTTKPLHDATRYFSLAWT